MSGMTLGMTEVCLVAMLIDLIKDKTKRDSFKLTELSDDWQTWIFQGV